MAGQYIYGNVVPKYQEKYNNNERIRIKERPRSKTLAERQKLEKALSFDLPYLFVLTVATAAALIICWNYLKVQSSITSSIKNIEAQEAVLENLRSENDALETRINSSVNLDYVYKVATEELGMVYAKENQVITYDRAENEYVRQNEDIK